MIYENYDFKFTRIVIGAMGYVPKILNRYLQDLELTQKQSQHLTRILQFLPVSGTVKISQTFLKFNKF